MKASRDRGRKRNSRNRQTRVHGVRQFVARKTGLSYENCALRIFLRGITERQSFPFLVLPLILAFLLLSPGCIFLTKITTQNQQATGDTSGALRVVVRGSFAYTGIGSKIIVLDISNPATPTVAGESAALSAPITNIASVDDFIYATSNDKKLHVINISDPVNPIEIGSHQTQVDAFDIIARDKYIFVIGSQDGCVANVFNITDPARPSEVGMYDGTSPVAAIGLINNYAYAASSQGGLTVVKLSEQGAPVKIGVYDVSGFSRADGNNEQRDSPVAEIDRTPPTLNVKPTSPEPNSSGWNNTDVTIDFTASDDLSGVASVSAPVTLTEEGANQTVIGMATDMAGNIAWTKVGNINIDKTPPTITGFASPAPNANGWNNTDVVVTFSASDALSGLATAPGKVVVKSEGANQSVVGTATDKAGNSTSYTVSNINIDKSKPIVDIVEPKVSVYRTSESIKIIYAAADEFSGIDTITATLDGKPVQKGETINLSKMAGNHKLTVIARDKAGNETSTSTDFVVRVAGILRVEPSAIIRSTQENSPITAYINFPSNYDINLVNVSTLDCAVNGRKCVPLKDSNRIRDYDGDGNAELLTQFDRNSFLRAIGPNNGTAIITLDGRLSDGRYFVASSVVSVIGEAPAQ